MVKTLDAAGYRAALQEKDKTVVIVFGADWCPHCKRLEPLIEETANENIGKIDAFYVDVDKNPELAEQNGIMAIPAVIIAKGGKIVKNATNPRTKQILLDLIFK